MRVSEFAPDWRKPKPVPVPKPAKPKKARAPDEPLFKPRKLPLPFNKPKPDNLS